MLSCFGVGDAVTVAVAAVGSAVLDVGGDAVRVDCWRGRNPPPASRADGGSWSGRCCHRQLGRRRRVGGVDGCVAGGAVAGGGVITGASST